MKVVFFGSSIYVLPIIEVLKKDFELTLVVTTEKENGAVPKFCTEDKIPFVSISKFDEKVIGQLLEVRSEIAVVADFGLILPLEILNAFEHGVLNIHPSLLPKYRGPTPVQTAILNGDEKTGVSIIKLDEKMDHGPILKQVGEPILESDTAESLYQNLFEKGAQILSDSIKNYLAKELTPIAQNDKEATYTKKLIKNSGYFDFNNPPSKNQLEKMVRAYYPWPSAWTRLRLGFGGQAKLRIVKFLPGEKIQVEGKKPMNYKDFLNGYPEAKEWLFKLFPSLF